MGTVIFDISMSLDGYMTAAGQTPEEPMGPGGLRLVEWAMGDDERGRQLLDDAVGQLGASIAGRRTYDTSLPWWGADGPSGEARRPVFVVTHREPEEIPEGSVYEFVTGGIEAALERAQAAAGERAVVVMGGADLGRQYIAAGLVDEISIHTVPVLFGGGTRMFDGSIDEHINLEPIEVVETPVAIHQRFRVVDTGRTPGA
jgi:dihydrofolate reductase